MQGRHPTLLKVSYRNTVEILKAATLLLGDDAAPEDEDDSLDMTLFPDYSTDRHGPWPVLERAGDCNSLIENTLEDIQRQIGEFGCVWSDIGVLYPDSHDQFPQRLYEAFVKRFGADKIFWVNTREQKKHFDLGSNTVKLCSIHSAKGMEFKVVFLVGLERLPRYPMKEQAERRLAYVGMTRAQDLLYLPYLNSTGFIQQLEPVLNGEAIHHVGR